MFGGSYNYTDNRILKLFEELGIPHKLAKNLIEISGMVGDDKHIERILIDDVYDEKDRCGIVVYETIRYPPKSIPPGQTN